MSEKINDLFHRFYDPLIAWYNGLDQLPQVGVLYGIGFLCLLMVAFFLISRTSR